MIYELRTDLLQTGMQQPFLAHMNDVGLRVRKDAYGTLEGYWSSEFGLLNRVFHLWSFASLEERARLLAELGRNEKWTRDYAPKARSMLLGQESVLLDAAAPLDKPSEAPNVYELRCYTTHPGKAPEWLAIFKDAALARRKLSRIVGVWSTGVGSLDQVWHLWCYRDLKERAAIRAQAAADPVWKEFAGKVPALVARMESVILNPAAFSPLR